jgi:putative chitinase
MTPLTVSTLAAAARIPVVVAETWVEPLNAVMEAYAIATPTRQAAFIAQLAHESAGFTKLEEDLDYSASRLMQVWPKRFPTLDVALRYAHNPEKLGNYVYANRMGNGDEASGDGYRYRARGPIGLTGLNNYAEASLDLFGNDRLLHYPEHVKDSPLCGATVAARYWYKRRLNDLADQGDFEGIGNIINTGRRDVEAHGTDDRLARTDHALEVLA